MPRRKRNQVVQQETRTVNRVVMYRRVSKVRDHMTTMDTQKGLIENYCAVQGWDIVADLADPDISAWKGFERPDFDKAIEMIERGQADGIVVFKLDRFARNLSEFWEAHGRIKAAGGSFISLSENFDTDGPYGPILLGILAAFAQMESQAKSDRAIPAALEDKRMGKVGPGPRPYGYDKVTSKPTKNNPGNDGAGAILTINEKEAALIRIAADWVLAGRGLISFISTHQPESSQANKKMTYRGLRHTLTNPTTAGLREYKHADDGSGFQPGCWEPILSREDWEALRVILLDPSRRSVTTNQRAHLLSGILVCSKCNKGMFSRNWNNPRTKAKSKRYACAGCWTSVEMESADRIAMELLWEAVPQSKWQTWVSAGKGWDPAVLEDIESRMAFVDSQYTAGKINDQRWAKMMAELDEQLSAAQNQEPLDIPQVPNVRDAWDAFDLDDKQRVFRQAFSRVKLLPASGSRDPRTRLAVEEHALAV